MKKVKITPKANKSKNIKKIASINIIEDDGEAGSIETKPKNFFEVQNDEDILMQEMYGMNYTVFIVPKYLTQAKDIKYQILDYLNDSQLLPIQRKTKTFEYDGKKVEIFPGFERFNKTQTLMYIQKLYNRIISEATKKGSQGYECVLCCQEITHWIDIQILDTENEEIKKYKPARKKPVKKEKEKESTLREIWIADDEKYDLMIEFLKKENKYIDDSFVKVIKGKLTWNETPYHFWNQYAAGFIYTCVKAGIIRVVFAPTFKRILDNTFNTNVSLNRYKNLMGKDPGDKYLDPFKPLKQFKN